MNACGAVDKPCLHLEESMRMCRDTLQNGSLGCHGGEELLNK